MEAQVREKVLRTDVQFEDFAVFPHPKSGSVFRRLKRSSLLCKLHLT